MMGETSNISWTDATYNPWYGCHKISPGCAYCYMDRWARRSGRDPETVTHAKEATFYAPLKWKEPKRVFTCSLSDYFIEEADPWRSEADAVMRVTSQHTYLILTKRIERAIALNYKPPSNALLGISAENQRMLNQRAWLLFRIPAAGYFLSLEPLLGPINLATLFAAWRELLYPLTVIVGGESGGPDHRRLVQTLQHDRDMVRSIRDQCLNAGVKFHFKQWGGARPDSYGAILDGREWREFPMRKKT